MHDERPVRVRRSSQKPAKRGGGLLGCLAGGLLLVAILVGIVGMSAWYLFLRPDADVAPGTQLEITIKKGSGTSAIAHQLGAAGVIRNANMFRYKARELAVDGKLRSGTYALSTGMPDEVVLDKLQRGPDIVYFTVTIPEGFTAQQIAARFAKQAGVSEDEMLSLATGGADLFADRHGYLTGARGGSLQGYLFPDTYTIKKGTKPEAIIEMMLDRFDEQIAKVDLSYAKKHGFDLDEVLTIASILDREVKVDKEYELVSSVIYNRIRIGMKLQMCSTVVYGLRDGHTKLTTEDLTNGHPYNTYCIVGLPPGPMGSPGLRAIRAAAKPADTKYIYFVLTGKDGSQTFASNYADFLKAKAKYKEVFGE